MIIQAMFEYPAKLTLPKCRNEREVRVIDRVAATVSEVAGDEAPVALRCENFGFDRWRPRDSVEETVELRAWNGALWRAAKDASGGRDLRGAAFADAVAAGEGGGTFQKIWRGGSAVEADILGKARYDADAVGRARAEAAAKAFRTAADHLVIDGRLWCRSREPVYLVDFDRDAVAGLEIVWDSEVKIDRGASYYWRLDRLDDALAECARLNEQIFPGRDHPPRPVPQVELLLPDALGFVFDQRGRVEQVASAVRDAMAERLASAPLGYLVAYAHLRDALAAVPVDHGAVVVVLGDEVLPLVGGEGLAGQIEHCVEEWCNRPDAPIADGDVAALGA